MGDAAGPVINGRYQLLQEIGKGRYGITYCARDMRTNEIVAIKQDTKIASLSFQHEINVLRDIAADGANCQYFPTFLESIAYNDTLLTVLSLEGANMNAVMEHLPGHKFNRQNILTFLYYAAHALHALHVKNYVHRDVVPGNFVRNRSAGKAPILLLDFGFAQACDMVHRHFQLPDANLLAVPQACPIILEGEAYDDRCDFFQLAFSALSMMGYGMTNVINMRMTREFRATRINQIWNTCSDWIHVSDQYIIPVLRLLYTPGRELFNFQNLLDTITMIEGFNPMRGFVQE